MTRINWIYLLGLFAAASFMVPHVDAQIINEQNACSWGISNDSLAIPSDSIIRDASLTLYGVRAVAGSQAAVYVQLLNNPVDDIEELADAKAGNFFDAYGTLLKQITAAELSSTPRNITIPLNSVNDPKAWVWTQFDSPVVITFGDASTQQLSSSLLTLMDYAGTGRSFGFGLDCDGAAVEGMSLELTIQSTTASTAATTLTFQTGTTGTTTPNSAPVLAAIADKTVRAMQPLTFSLAATDADNDTVTYSVANLPQGALFIGNTFAWTPGATQTGTYNIPFTASDGQGGTDTQTARITVSAATAPGEWVTLAFDDFEAGWGSYTDGGSDCLLYTRTKYAPQGTSAANIQSSSDSSSFALANPIDIQSPGYSELQISFSFMAVSMDSSTDGFSLEYWDGSQWVTLNSWYTYTDFSNWAVYTETVELSKSTIAFSADMKIRFVCHAADTIDDVMIDEIRISAR